MSDRVVPPQQMHEVGWRIVRDSACTHLPHRFVRGGRRLVDAIGGLAEVANHHPDVDLRPDGVTVRLRRRTMRVS